MKAIPCTLICNTSLGYTSIPQNFPSISSAVKYAKESFYFAYRIFDIKGNLLKRGYCK